jgi:hypothetical protein
MKNVILKVALVLSLLGTGIILPTAPASAHGSCSGTAGSMQGVFHDSAWIVVACGYSHYKSVISGYVQFNDCSPSCTGWVKAGPAASAVAYNANGVGTTVQRTLSTGECRTGDKIRSYISSYRIYNSSLVLVHSLSGAITGPVYTCGQ